MQISTATDTPRRQRRQPPWWALAAASLAACGPAPDKSAALPIAALPAVNAAVVIKRTAPVTTDVVGEIRAYREVDLRPRVTGVVDAIRFEPGQQVRRDQVLFRIDARVYASAVADATASVSDAEATLSRVRQDLARYRPLVADNAIPRQVFDQTVSQEKQALAALASRKAQLERARLDLSYTDVRSPVTGQVGLQKIEEGALVTAGSTVLATVSTLDPVLAYFSVAESFYVEFVRRHGSGAKAREEAGRPIEMLLPDGSRYAHAGLLDFVDRVVSASTGTLQLRARFANPEGLLKPGLNVRLRLNPETVRDALLVPQRAVGDLLGRQFVLVLGDGDTVEQRFVKMGERVDGLWVATEGLKAGERVVVDGLQKAQPGQKVVARMLGEGDLALSATSAQPENPAPAGATR